MQGSAGKVLPGRSDPGTSVKGIPLSEFCSLGAQETPVAWQLDARGSSQRSVQGCVDRAQSAFFDVDISW